MSLLPNDTFVNAGRALWAVAGSGGGGGGSTLQSPASVTAASSGICQFTVGSNDSAPATLTVTTGGGGADLGAAAINLIGGVSSILAVECDGAGAALVNVTGGTAGNATINVLSQGANNATLNMGTSTTFATVLCNSAGNLSFTPDSGVTALTVVNSPPNLLATGLKLSDAGGQAGAITGQNVLGPSAAPLNGGAPATNTIYALPNPGSGATTVGWWLYSVGTSEVSGPSVQACVSVMAYWNGTTFSKGGNVSAVIGGSTGWLAGTFAQMVLSNDRTTVTYAFNIGVSGSLATMSYAATQMTGAQTGF